MRYMSPSISEHYQQREPSAIRKAQLLFNSRKDKKNIEAIIVISREINKAKQK